jgi:hypothetical protein
LGKVTEDNDGKILEDENDEEIVFENKTYWRLIEVYGGVSQIVYVLLIALVMAILNVKLDHVLTTWVADSTGQGTLFKQYILKIVFLATCNAVLGFLKERSKDNLMKKSKKFMRKEIA